MYTRGVVSPSIRLAKAADLPGIARVHAASVRGLCAGHYRRGEIDAWLAPGPGLYARLLKSSTVFVAEMAGEVVGFAAVRLATREVPALYVAPSAAGAGLGLRLLRRVERVARAVGIRELRLSATLNAVAFYERSGWRREAEAVGGRGHRCVPMRKRLRAPE